MSNRLQSLQSALAARGVRDVKVVWSPDAQVTATPQAREDSLVMLLESYLAGKLTPILQAEGL